jgi:hypothetical protein
LFLNPNIESHTCEHFGSRNSRNLFRFRYAGGTTSRRRTPPANKERIREKARRLPTLEYLVERVEAGWRARAIERELDSSAAGGEAGQEEIPFGLRVSDSYGELVGSQTERQMIITARI